MNPVAEFGEEIIYLTYFLLGMGVKKRDALSPLLFNFVLEYIIK